MQTKTWHPSGWFKLCIVPAVSMLVAPVSTSHGQTQVSLQALQPAPQVTPSAFASLPDPMAPNPPMTATTQAGLETQTWALRELPKMHEVEVKAPLVVADLAVHAVPSANAEPSNTPPIMAVVSLSALPSQQDKPAAKKDWKVELQKYFVLDVNSLTKQTTDVDVLFNDLKTDRKYFESALVAEPVRMQSPEIGPYLWNSHAYCWESPSFCYSPLYFEQPNLERYGQGVGRPFASTSSAMKFVADVTTLPIAVVCTPPWSSSCTLGHHRPGDCAPYQRKTLDH